MKVNSQSVSKDHVIYIDITNDHIVAVDKVENKKIQEAHSQHKQQANIPEQLIVEGRLLGENVNGHYEDNSRRLHEYKIKNLKFASSNIEWV